MMRADLRDRASDDIITFDVTKHISPFKGFDKNKQKNCLSGLTFFDNLKQKIQLGQLHRGDRIVRNWILSLDEKTHSELVDALSSDSAAPDMMALTLFLVGLEKRHQGKISCTSDEIMYYMANFAMSTTLLYMENSHLIEIVSLPPISDPLQAIEASLSIAGKAFLDGVKLW